MMLKREARTVLAAISFVVLAGCDPAPSDAEAHQDRAANTFAGKLVGCAGVAEGFGRDWVDQPYGEFEAAQDDVSTLPISSLRVIRPGTMVTEDYLPDRLNVTLDKNDMVSKFHCG